MESDEDLVRRYRGGDDAAFTEIYRRYDRRLFAYLLLRTRDEHAAEDLLHDVFARFIEYVRDVEIYGSVRGFLYTSARNHAINWSRKGAPVAAALPELFEDPRGRVAREWLDSLPEEQREVVYLHLWGGLTFADIGAVQGVPSNTAMSRYRYAMEKLRRDERE